MSLGTSSLSGCSCWLLVPPQNSTQNPALLQDCPSSHLQAPSTASCCCCCPLPSPGAPAALCCSNPSWASPGPDPILSHTYSRGAELAPLSLNPNPPWAHLLHAVHYTSRAGDNRGIPRLNVEHLLLNVLLHQGLIGWGDALAATCAWGCEGYC